MRKLTVYILGGVAIVALPLTVMALHFGTTDLHGRLRVFSSATAPTCAVAAGNGDICAADDLEAEDDVDAGDDITSGDDITVGDDLVVTDDASVGGDIAVTGEVEAATVKSVAPMMLLDMIRFCGQAANADTPHFIGPITQALEDDGNSYAYGSAGCDGLDHATEATADAVYAAGFALKVVGMMCSVDDGGTDDALVFQLRDDAADVAGVTCSITLDGAGFDVCTVLLDSPVTIAAGSAIAVESVAVDDDCSGCDVECRAFITY